MSNAGHADDDEPFEVLSRRVVLEHPYLSLSLITARDPRNGGEFEALSGTGPDLVYVVPAWPDGTITLVRTHRFGVDGTSLEVPGGHVDPGEDHLVASHRELREETGLGACDMTYLFTCLLSGKIQQRVHHYVAQGLSVGAQDLDVGETIEPTRMPLSEALTLATSGGVAQGMSALSILAAARHLDL